MVDIVKPDISSVWAEAGAVIAPSNEKIKLGWTSEVPPHQYENFVQNRQDEMLAYLNQKGVPEWRIDTEYFLGKSFVQDAGKIYKANKNSGGLLPNQKPSTDATNEYWEQATFSLSDLKQAVGTSTKDVMSQKATTDAISSAIDGLEAGTVIKSDLVQTTGTSTKNVMSQKAVTEKLALKIEDAPSDGSPYVRKDGEWVVPQDSDLGDIAKVVYNMATDTWLSGTEPKATEVHKGMRRCMVKDGVLQYYLNNDDSTYKEDGVELANFSGVDGDVMVHFANKAYTRTTVSGDIWTWELSSIPHEGFELYPAFDGVDNLYIGAFEAIVFSSASGSIINGLNLDNNTSRVNLTDDRLRSLPSNFQMVGLTRNQFRTLARSSGLQQLDFWQMELLKYLFITEYGSLNSQLILGDGNSNKGSWPENSSNQSSSHNNKCGLSLTLGNHSGGISSPNSVSFVSYRGVENLWGNSWTWCDGVNIDDRQYLVSNDESIYADDTSTGYTPIGNVSPSATTSYIKSVSTDAGGFSFIPKSVGGSSNSYFSDGFWSETGWRVLFVGGSADAGLLGGLFCAHGALAASNSNRNRGCRVSLKDRGV